MNLNFRLLSRFDRAVGLVIVVTLLLIFLVSWRGDQVGIQVVTLSPAPNANHIPLHTRLQVRFDQGIISDTQNIQLSFTPAVSGSLQIAGDQLIFIPTSALQPLTTYAVTLNAGLRSTEGRRLRKPLTWQFATGQTQVLYSTTVSNTEQLFLTTVDLTQPTKLEHNATPRQVTFNATGIWDFIAAPDDAILYSVLNKDGSGDLWTLARDAQTPTKLIDCPQAICNSAAWSPDQRWLAFTKRNNTSFSSGALSPPRLWLLDRQTQQAAQLFDDKQRLGFEPRWSSDGQWLSYLAPDMGGVGVHNIVTQAEHFYPTPTGETGRWHPRQNQVLISITKPSGERASIHLLRIDVAPNEQRDLSGANNLVEDNGAAWSPDGEWIAFRRKELIGPQATLGAQLWLMRADGSQARALTRDPAFDHGQLSWSPDGRYLLFQKLPLKGPDVTISVWLLDVQSGQQWEIARPGQRPVWLP